jgi:hypothetical protein
MTTAETAFAAFGLATQALLLAYFAGRRWAPRSATRYYWLVYAFAGLGLPLGWWLLAQGLTWRLFAGPLLTALWAGFGALVDLWRPRPWRGPPILWAVFVPYVALYFSAQMFMWWPLWDIERAAWGIYLMLFVPNTALNIRGHFDEG